MPSTILHHQEDCCRTALAWLHGVDASHCYHRTQWYPPTWIRKKYNWGPIQWPIYWCDLPNAEQLDCGALAALAVNLYQLRQKSAVSVQMALHYPTHATEQWRNMWERQGVNASWISGEYCYHEACGILEGQELLLWDPTESRWIDPPSSLHEIFASVVALRVYLPENVPAQTVKWNTITIHTGIWNNLNPDQV